jgi:type I site-specific restriction-modification system R (restriction) subunit
LAEVNRVLDKSIKVKEQYVIKNAAGSHVLDMSKVDFDALKKLFDASRKNIELARLRGKINAQLQAMLRQNKSRIDFAAKFEQLIADYNAGGKDIDTFFVEVISFARSLSEEEQRGVSENLSEEELAIFDLLIRPNIKLNKNASRSSRSPKNYSTPSKPNASSSTGANNKRPALPFAWRFSTRWNNCLSLTPRNSTTRSANWSINTFMRWIQI